MVSISECPAHARRKSLLFRIGSFRLLAELAWLISAGTGQALGLFDNRSEEIEERITQLEREAAALPKARTTRSPWTLGYTSALGNDDSKSNVTIEIRFREPIEIDLVVLVPATFLDDDDSPGAFGFPKRFLIERLNENGESEIIVDHRDHDYLEPGIEPQLFPFEEAGSASGIRITATGLGSNPTWWDGDFLLALSEVLVFSGEWNVALGSEVETSSSWKWGYTWSPECLVDGFTHSSPVQRVDEAVPYHNYLRSSDPEVLTFDLGEVRNVDEFRLWPVVHSLQHNFPPSTGIGFPMGIRLEVAREADYSDAKVVYESPGLGMKPGAVPMMVRLERALTGRYFRFTLSDGVADFRAKGLKSISVAEIELLGSGILQSANAIVYDSDPEGTAGNLRHLTDGLTNEGRLIPLREWIESVHKRAGLDQKLAILRRELIDSKREDEEWVRTTLLVVSGLVVMLVLSIVILRLLAERRWNRMRERIAGDLHDEIGANISSIANTAELMRETLPEASDKQDKLLADIIDTARLSSRETSSLVRFIELQEHGGELTEHLRETARRILVNLEHQISIRGERGLNRLKPDRQWDLLLFFKEALNNVIKHSGAKNVTVEVEPVRSGFHLLIADDGVGIPETRLPLRHLESRARRLNGNLQIESDGNAGTRIKLSFKS